jgi:hypothetical protein
MSGVDDTRDIAIRALESGKAAHNRLNGINGQIGRLGDSHERMREDFNDANLSLVETVTALKTTVSNTLKVAGAVVALVVSIASGVTVYAITHRPAPTPPAQASTQHP